MYRPRAFRVDGDEAVRTIERAGFGHLVSHGPDGFAASGLPLLVDRNGDEVRALRGHVARANPHWQSLDGVSVLLVFQGRHGYVTPSWYPSKVEHGKVVPTWNYEVVHVHGTATVHDDVEWLRRMVTDLTDHHESTHDERTPRPSWAVTDAPDDFVEKMLRGIVGVEVAVERIEGAAKLSQNRPEGDRRGVADGLLSSGDLADEALGRAVDDTNG